MKNFKISFKNKVGWGAVILLLIAVVVGFSLLFNANIDQRLNAKLSEYAKAHGMSIEDVKKDKTLMIQLQMESDQEEKIDNLTQNIEVTKEEIENYRNMIGTSMNQKKAVLILFNTQDECKGFISEHGNDKKPETCGVGVIPLMHDDENGSYYNVVGNEVLESAFDNLIDGEYTKEPFLFSGMYCYLKRIGISSPVSDEQELVKLIKNEKANDILKNKSK